MNKLIKYTLARARCDHARVTSGFPNVDFMNGMELIEKYLEVLDLIRTRNVNVTLIKNSKNYNDYCGDYAIVALSLQNEKLFGTQQGITKEEYKLLKKVLNDSKFN